MKISTLETLSALDGPGVRFTIFLHGCNLRCIYCHNPETWASSDCQNIEPEDLFKKILRYKPYFKTKGGVTFSGGEPLLQAEEVTTLAKMLQSADINVAIDTSGSIINNHVKELLKLKPLILLDIKMPSEELYQQHIKGSLRKTLDFLLLCEQSACEVWVRYVVVPNINDKEEDVLKITELVNEFKCVSKIELLPYHSLGEEKYQNLKLNYPLSGLKPPSEKKMHLLKKIVTDNFKINPAN